MPATLIRTCPLCGLRFTNAALLELHLREDHRRRRPGTAPADTPGRLMRSPAPEPLSLPRRRGTRSESRPSPIARMRSWLAMRRRSAR